MKDTELLDALRSANAAYVVTRRRTAAAEEWLKLCRSADVRSMNAIEDARKAIDAVTDVRDPSTYGDIYKTYGLHHSQLFDGLPVTDPRTVEPVLQPEPVE